MAEAKTRASTKIHDRLVRCCRTCLSRMLVVSDSPFSTLKKTLHFVSDKFGLGYEGQMAT